MLFDNIVTAERHEAIIETLTLLEASRIKERAPTLQLIEIAETIVDNAPALSRIIDRAGLTAV